MPLVVELEPLDGARALRRAAEHGVHPRQQLDRAEGLGHVVVRPVLQAAHAVRFGPAGGPHDHGQGGARRPDGAEDVEAVQARQHDVEQDEIDAAL